MNESVVIKNVTKKYRMYKSNKERLKDLIIPGKAGRIFMHFKILRLPLMKVM